MAKIQDFTIPIAGTANNLLLKSLPFDMEANECEFYYELQNLTPKDFENSYDIKIIFSGNIKMNNLEYSAWGADNSYCLQWAATKLGLTLI